MEGSLPQPVQGPAITPGDMETVPQVQEVMSPLLCLQARSSTKHPRICSPLATAALSHRELRYQHCPETDPPTAMGSQAGKMLWGPAPRTGDLPHPPPSTPDKSELCALSPQSPWDHKLGVSSPPGGLSDTCFAPPCPMMPSSDGSVGKEGCSCLTPSCQPSPWV